MALLPTEPLQITEPLPRRGRNDLRRNLVGLSRDDLKATLVEAGLEPFRARQVWRWVAQGASSFEAMTDLPKRLRETLAAEVPFSTLTLEHEARARDGTVKALFSTADGRPVEAVLMRYRDGRRSLCLSSQSGCPLTCTFCATGSMRFGRNLDAAESTARQVLKMYAKSLPPRHLYVAATRHLLGEVLLRRGQLSEAESELRAALDIDLGSAGPGDWRAARTKASLGWLLIAEGNAAEGETMLVAARSTLLKTVGPLHPEVELATKRLADYYHTHHREAEAVRVLDDLKPPAASVLR